MSRKQNGGSENLFPARLFDELTSFVKPRFFGLLREKDFWKPFFFLISLAVVELSRNKKKDIQSQKSFDLSIFFNAVPNYCYLLSYLFLYVFMITTVLFL